MRWQQREDLADRLEQLGKFEIYRTSANDQRSAQVWLTEAERDAIVAALRGEFS